MRVRIMVEIIYAYRRSWTGSRYLREILKAEATVDQSRTVAMP